MGLITNRRFAPGRQNVLWSVDRRCIYVPTPLPSRAERNTLNTKLAEEFSDLYEFQSPQ